jgi:signal transduction histidine kinase
MTGSLFLNWATMAVSLFNTILALWLGLTVLLSAERRTWGIWLASGGLLLGGVFFVSHSAILGHGLAQGVELWWQVGWLPVIALPLAWYVLTLWYAGFWGDGGADLPFWQCWGFVFSAPFTGSSRLHKRQRPWFIIAVLLGAGLVGLLVFTNALPSYWQVIQLNLATSAAVGGIPVLILAYPFYILLCIGLSLDALRRPEPSTRMMGEEARLRARPWLMGVTIALLLASLLVIVVLASVVLGARYGRGIRSFDVMALGVGLFDLIIASLIGVAIVLLGQAIVSYELFTGRSLPRRGFFRHWYRAVILAAGYGVVVGGSFALKLGTIYSLLLTVVIMVAFYALLVWRTFAERERTIDHLRPFVASQRLYERLLSPTAPPDLDVRSLLRALCEDVLDARTGILAAVGPMAPLAGPPLAYPSGNISPLPSLSEIAAQFDSPQTMSIPLDPARYGATWAVGLWGERGLIGVLLLGEKRGGGLYTQEEIEIARAGGERLIDAQASAEMARRLMALQRQRLAESQVLDQRARRVLHDEVLPRLHAAMLTLSDKSHTSTVEALAETHRQIADLLHEMPTATAPEVARLGLIGALRQVVDEEFGNAFDDVAWEIEPRAEQKAQAIPTLTAEVLFYAAREAVRNAARHGRGQESDPLHLRIGAAWRNGLELVIEDDGVGLRAEGQSSEGSGHGLALHSTMMAVVGGTLAVESAPGAYTRVTLRLPVGDWRPASPVVE